MRAAPDGGVAADPAPPSPGTAKTELRLPWIAGETWYLTSGPHGQNRTALDFAPPNLDPRTKKPYPSSCSRQRGNAHWVRAAAAGRISSVLRFGCPLVQIIHDDGTTTNYFHLRRSSVKHLRLKVGDRVEAGQILGRPSCEVGPKRCGATHPASGVHVHFYRTDAATTKRLPAEGMLISGWKVSAARRLREGTLARGDEIRSARGAAVGYQCPLERAPRQCGEQRNDLESDNVAATTTADAVSLESGKSRRKRKAK